MPRRLAFLLLILAASCSREAPPGAIVGSIKAEDLRKHQTYLASEALEGRKAGSAGGAKAAEYIEAECRRLKLIPKGTDGGYFFPFGDQGMKDIVAMWPGSDPEAGWLAVSAHYDHLGRKDGKLYLGADDNASGTSVVLEIAQAAVQRKFRRSIVFFWFDGEELGLFGSKAWIAAPTLPVDSCSVMLNIDMVGRNDPRQIIVCLEKDDRGSPRYPLWAAAIREVEAPFDISFDWKSADNLIRRSDNWPFMEKGVPAAFFTGGLHDDYHTPNDTVDRIDFAKEERVGRVLYTIIARCADYNGGFR